MGDFNESHSGLYWGKACNWLESDYNMKDAINEHDPNTNTWYWPLKYVTLTAHFDHIFYDTTNFKCLKGKVHQEGASDHFPVVAELVFKTS